MFQRRSPDARLSGTQRQAGDGDETSKLVCHGATEPKRPPRTRSRCFIRRDAPLEPVEASAGTAWFVLYMRYRGDATQIRPRKPVEQQSTALPACPDWSLARSQQTGPSRLDIRICGLSHASLSDGSRLSLQPITAGRLYIQRAPALSPMA